MLIRLLVLQIKSADSPITRIFGGKFRTTLKVGSQKSSATVEDWRAVRLDISVCSYGHFSFLISMTD